VLDFVRPLLPGHPARRGPLRPLPVRAAHPRLPPGPVVELPPGRHPGRRGPGHPPRNGPHRRLLRRPRLVAPAALAEHPGPLRLLRGQLAPAAVRRPLLLARGRRRGGLEPAPHPADELGPAPRRVAPHPPPPARRAVVLPAAPLPARRPPAR